MPSIVVLDDDPFILDLLRTVLDDAGYASITAARLDDISADARADLVISDLIPVKAYTRAMALEWIATLRRRFGHAPILVVTAHGAAVREPDALGVGGVVGKPFDVDEVLQKLKDLVGGITS